MLSEHQQVDETNSAGRFRVVAFIGWLLATALVTFLLLAPIGCHIERDYEILSFFFDGVPKPGEVSGADGTQLTEADDVPAGTAQNKSTQIQYIYHTPYQNRNCFGCHDQKGGYSAPVGQNQCNNCHQSYFKNTPDNWVHGPVAMFDCNYCHESHKSEHKGLLKKEQLTICFECHDKKFIERDPYHGKLDIETCSQCHEIHSAGNRLLLIDSRTYRRRKSAFLPAKSAHDMWGTNDCNNCHDVKNANQLRPQIEQVCLSCHKQITENADPEKTHAAVLQKKCLVCHAPHKSPLAHLIRPDAEQICYTCHKLDEVKSPKHPKVTRVECLLCHKGHQSKRPHLLQEGIDQIAVPKLSDETQKTNETERGANH